MKTHTDQVILHALILNPNRASSRQPTLALAHLLADAVLANHSNGRNNRRRDEHALAAQEDFSTWRRGVKGVGEEQRLGNVTQLIVVLVGDRVGLGIAAFALSCGLGLLQLTTQGRHLRLCYGIFAMSREEKDVCWMEG